jgi:hypothetical protein
MKKDASAMRESASAKLDRLQAAVVADRLLGNRDDILDTANEIYFWGIQHLLDDGTLRSTYEGLARGKKP